MITPAGTVSGAAHERSGHAVLFLDGRPVGTVEACGGDTSWGFGTFFPNDAFADYAPLFGAWSLLMHAESDTERLSKEAAREVARAEATLDLLKASLFFTHERATVPVAQLIIEGNQLEWKEY